MNIPKHKSVRMVIPPIDYVAMAQKFNYASPEELGNADLLQLAGLQKIADHMNLMQGITMDTSNLFKPITQKLDANMLSIDYWKNLTPEERELKFEAFKDFLNSSPALTELKDKTLKAVEGKVLNEMPHKSYGMNSVNVSINLQM